MKMTRQKTALVLMLFVTASMTSCATSLKNNPIDEMQNWTRATIAFATAVEAVTASGKAGEITRAQGKRFLPAVEEGQDLLNQAYANIASTPKDQDPTFDPALTHRLLRLGIQITAQLAVEKQRKKDAEAFAGGN